MPSGLFSCVFFILADIIFRTMNIPLSGPKESVANSVVIIVFMQVRFAVRSESMLRADFLAEMFPAWVQKILLIASLIPGAVFFFFLLKPGIKPALSSFANGEFDGEGALWVLVWPARLAIMFSDQGAGEPPDHRRRSGAG